MSVQIIIKNIQTVVNSDTECAQYSWTYNGFDVDFLKKVFVDVKFLNAAHPWKINSIV